MCGAVRPIRKAGRRTLTKRSAWQGGLEHDCSWRNDGLFREPGLDDEFIGIESLAQSANKARPASVAEARRYLPGHRRLLPAKLPKILAKFSLCLTRGFIVFVSITPTKIYLS
jgi:hypothetical protein